MDKKEKQGRGRRYLWLVLVSLLAALLLEGAVLFARPEARRFSGGTSVFDRGYGVSYVGYEQTGAHLRPQTDDPQIWIVGLEGDVQSVALQLKLPEGTEFSGDLYYPDESGALSEVRTIRFAYDPEVGQAVAQLPRGEYDFLRIDINSECDLEDILVGSEGLVSVSQGWEPDLGRVAFLFVGSFLFGVCWIRWSGTGEQEKKKKLSLRWSWALFLYCLLLVAMAVTFSDIHVPDETGLGRFTLLVGVVTVMVSLVFAYVIYRGGWTKEGLFAAVAFSVGLLYLVTITPLAVPDEAAHCRNAYWVSDRILLQSEAGDRVDVRALDQMGFKLHYNTAAGYQRVLWEIGGREQDGAPVPMAEKPGYFVQYLPQGLGIAGARAAGRNFVTAFFLGRLFNLIFFTGCLYFAVKRTPRFKVSLGLVGIMPMTLHQAASLSYDAFVNGMAFVLIASILKAIYEEGELSKGDYFWILVTGVLLAPCKVIYCAILPLCLLIPRERFGKGREKLIGVALILLAAAVCAVVFQMRGLAGMAGGGDGLNWEGGHNYTLSFVFSHPLRTVKIFARTLLERVGYYFSTMVGSSLCGYTLPVPFGIVLGFTAVAFLSAMRQQGPLPGVHRGSFFLVAAVVTGLAMLSMFLAWTSDTRSVIEGVQGRYLIPIFPLLLFGSSSTLALERDIDKELVTTAVLLHGNVIASVLSYTVLH